MSKVIGKSIAKFPKLGRLDEPASWWRFLETWCARNMVATQAACFDHQVEHVTQASDLSIDTRVRHPLLLALPHVRGDYVSGDIQRPGRLSESLEKSLREVGDGFDAAITD
jgi:hypothetical protein